MNKLKKYAVFGPQDSLKRLGSAMISELKPKFEYHNVSGDQETIIQIAVFEEYQRQINSSNSLTCVYEYSNRSVKVELMPTGGRMGFRGSSLDSKQPLVDMVVSFLLDFSKRYGLTYQEIPVLQPED